MEISPDIIEIARNKFIEEEEQQLPGEDRITQEIKSKDGELLGYKIYLGHLPEGQRGLQWLVLLADKNKANDLKQLDPKRFSEWNESEPMKILNMEKLYDAGGNFLGKKYSLGPVDEASYELAMEKLSSN